MAKNTISYRPFRRSEILAYKACPYSYYLWKVRGVEGGNRHTKRGVEKHSLFERALKGEVSLDKDDHSAWQRVKPIVITMTPEAKLYVNEHGKRCKPKDAFIWGQLDVHTHNMAVDYKMGQSGYFESTYDDSFKYQADWYMCLLAPDLTNTFPYPFVFLFPYISPREEKCPAKTFTYDIAEVPRLFKLIKEEVLDIEQELLKRDPAKPKSWEPDFSACDGCLYYESCDHIATQYEDHTGIVKVERGVVGDNVVRAIENHFKIKAMEKFMDASIRDYIEKNGPVEIDGKRYGFYDKTRSELPDIQSLSRDIISAGGDEAKLELMKAVKLTVTDAKRLGKKWKVDISGYIKERKINGFGFY